MQPESSTVTSPFYAWKPPGKPVSVQLQFEVIDRVLLDVMRGFGAVPKRGAEVGGVLLGTSEWIGSQLVVRVEDIEPVPCAHASGPSYILSADDRANLAAALQKWQKGPESKMYAVGFYRGHTRDGISLSVEDLTILEEYFPDPAAIALIVKPYATKVSIAGIFFREDGQFRADASYLEFPFRRKELGGGTSGVERQASAARFGQNRPTETPLPGFAAGSPAPVTDPIVPPTGGPLFSSVAASENSGKKSAIRSGWVWIPLSFIFMLLGTVLGFQIALSIRPKQPANPWLEAWDLSLSVKQTGPELYITWDPIAPAIRNSSRGALIIQSRNETRTIDLRGTQLQGGSVVYKGVPDHVVFRLEVYPREKITISEMADFKRQP